MEGVGGVKGEWERWRERAPVLQESGPLVVKQTWQHLSLTLSPLRCRSPLIPLGAMHHGKTPPTTHTHFHHPPLSSPPVSFPPSWAGLFFMGPRDKHEKCGTKLGRIDKWVCMGLKKDALTESPGTGTEQGLLIQKTQVSLLSKALSSCSYCSLALHQLLYLSSHMCIVTACTSKHFKKVSSPHQRFYKCFLIRPQISTTRLWPRYRRFIMALYMWTSYNEHTRRRGLNSKISQTQYKDWKGQARSCTVHAAISLINLWRNI